MHCTPIPTLPAVRIEHGLGRTDDVGEAIVRTDIITNITPGMMRASSGKNGTWAIRSIYSFDLGFNNIQGLFP